MEKWYYAWSGKYFYPFGNTYSGQWRNGKKHGEGTYTYAFGGNTLVVGWMIKNMERLIN